MPITEKSTGSPDAPMRPDHVVPVALEQLLGSLPEGLPVVEIPAGEDAARTVLVTGVAIDSRMVAPGDLYIALPGAQRHGAEFTAQAVAAGAHAVLTDDDGRLTAETALQRTGVPLLLADSPRELAGPVSAVVYDSQPDAGTRPDGDLRPDGDVRPDGGAHPDGGTRPGAARPVLFGVTGTNGKTTTTYFLNSLLAALGKSTGLIGTIEILAGGQAIPSALTTPESPQVHGLLALMRERGLDAASMEVSSHALEFRRVDGVVFDVAGFTNLTQDHLDLHGTMEDYFEAKAGLLRTGHARRAVVTVDDDWGWRMARRSEVETTTLSTSGFGSRADWQVSGIRREGLGNRFDLDGPHGERLSLRTGLPGGFNVSNAALATVMVLSSGAQVADVQQAADAVDPFTVEVPGRMQVISERPAGIVDFAHNPDALARTLESVRSETDGARVIVVFGATGQRDVTKRPVMGATAARLADVVIVTDDDPHDEDDAVIRRGVLEGAHAARSDGGLVCEILEVFPRADAIDRAVAMAQPADTVLIAGRGHEVWQEVKGVNLALDDRLELARALTRHGFSVLINETIES